MKKILKFIIVILFCSIFVSSIFVSAETQNEKYDNQDITVVHYHALNILDRMCFYNDIMIPVYSSFFLSIELVISYSKCISYSFTIHYQSNLFTR